MHISNTLLQMPGLGFLTRQPIAYLIGITGVGITLTNFPIWIKLVSGILGVLILVLVALIKYETWRTKRSDRLAAEDAEEIMTELEDRADNVEGVEPGDIQEVLEQHVYS